MAESSLPSCARCSEKFVRRSNRQKFCTDACRSKAYWAGLTEAQRERKRTLDRSWRAKNPEKVRQSSARSYIENRERARQANREYEQAHKEQGAARRRRWYEKNRELAIKRTAHWSAQNREKSNEYYRARRAKMPPLSPDLIRGRMDYFGGACWMCGGTASEVDHVKPIAQGGPHVPANLRPACRPCNSAKRARWYGVHQLDRFKKERLDA